jgi:HK97 family phage prohead protease
MKNDTTGGMHYKRMAFKAETVEEDGTFTGYGSVFGNVDAYHEVVEPGAFTESIKRIKASGDPLPALWQHRSDQPIGGYTDLVEDKHGLKVAGFLMVKEIPQAAQAHALMKRRIVKGLSIGYYIEDASFNEKTEVLSLRKLDLREISPVTFPANDLAEVDGVKQICIAGRMPTMREFEGFLRDAGFSKSQAEAVARHGLKTAGRGEPDTHAMLATALDTYAQSLNF